MNIIVLDAISKSITARIEGAHTTTAPSFVSAYADATASAFTEGANNGVLNGTTEVAIVAAPAASTRRMIREMTIYNADTVAHTLTISLLVTATYTIIRKVAIGIGGTYVFSNDASSFDMAATINTATAKTTPVDADKFGLWDSVSGLLNHVTWANIKNTLNSIFARLASANVFTATQKINTNSTAALVVEQTGVKNNVLVVDTSTGNVGIGTTNPNSQLQLTHDTTAMALENDYAFSIRPNATAELLMGVNTTGGFSFIQSFYPGINWTGKPLSLMPNAGNVGIGTTSPTSPLYVVGNCSADSFTDRTPHYDGDAVLELSKIKGVGGMIDHNTLPNFARKTFTKDIFEDKPKTDDKGKSIVDDKGNPIVEQVKIGTEEIAERDLGAMISMLTVAVQQLNDRIKKLETPIG